jgi:hypothetical protein
MLVACRLAGLSALDAHYAGVVALTLSDACGSCPSCWGRNAWGGSSLRPSGCKPAGGPDGLNAPSPSRRGRNAAHGPPQGLGGAVQALLTAATPISADAFAGVRVRDKLCTA